MKSLIVGQQCRQRRKAPNIGLAHGLAGEAADEGCRNSDRDNPLWVIVSEISAGFIVLSGALAAATQRAAAPLRQFHDAEGLGKVVRRPNLQKVRLVARRARQHDE